jgi:cobalt-zinc-cadmium resistance protein CzcA
MIKNKIDNLRALTTTVLIVSALMMTTMTSHGQTRLTLDECIQIADKNSYSIKAGKSEIEKSRILQGTAWDMNKTELSLGQDPTAGGSPDNALTLSQSFDFPTIYTARRNVLKAETNVATQQLNVIHKQLDAEITKTYELMVYTQERIQILASLDSVFRKDVSLATERYKAGESRQLEQLAAQRLLDENRIETMALQATYHSAQQQLMSLLNTSEPVIPTTEHLQIFSYTPPSDTNFDQTAEGQLFTHQLDRMNKKIKEAQTGFLPSFSIGLRNQLVISGWNPYHVDRSSYDKGSFMGFEVGVGIPLFFGATKAKVKAARKDQEITTLYKQQAAKRQHAAYQSLMSQYLAARNRVDYYEQTGNKRASEVSRIAQLSYENGEIGYIEYFNALKEAIDTRQKYAEAIHLYNQSVIDLQYLNQ